MQCCCNRYGFGPQQARPFVRLAARLDANFQGGYTPQQIRFAYDFTASSTGLGQTIALITTGNQPNIESDLRFFSSFFSLLEARLTIRRIGSVPENRIRIGRWKQRWTWNGPMRWHRRRISCWSTPLLAVSAI